jgi:hypothetical protein
MYNILRKFFLLARKFISSHKPNIIIDIIFDKGLFFISIKNIGKRSAYRTSIKFNNKIIGVEGTKDVSSLSLFKNIEFLPPTKEIITFLDTSTSYFKSKNPIKISANLTYYDGNGIKFNRVIKHDLDIYREIGFINKHHNKI